MRHDHQGPGTKLAEYTRQVPMKDTIFKHL